MQDQVEERARELAAHRIPFAQATVVRTCRPASAVPGDRALVLPDGAMDGFVGGTCVESTVRLYGLQVLASGQPILLCITPESSNGSVTREGLLTVHNPCLSGGELHIFLEPRRPVPRILVLGDTPIARNLVAIGPGAGYEIAAVEGPEVDEEALAEAVGVVAASHGRDERQLLSRALRAGVPYVGLVASRARGSAIVADLHETDRGRVRTPAGLPLGARTPGQAAVSILAEIIATPLSEAKSLRAAPADKASWLAAAPMATVDQALDPVCGMPVAAVEQAPHVDAGGRRTWFCSERCRDAFGSGAAGSVDAG